VDRVTEFRNWYYQQSGTNYDEYWQVRREYEGIESWQTFYSLGAPRVHINFRFAVELVHVSRKHHSRSDSKDYRLPKAAASIRNKTWCNCRRHSPLTCRLPGADTDQSGTTRATRWLRHGATAAHRDAAADDAIGFGIDYLARRRALLSEMIDLAPPMPDMGDGTLLGNGQGNTLAATAGGGHLFGMSGDDTLTGAAGNDVLVGGYGHDLLAGGAGDDLYVVRRGDGHDRIEETDRMPGAVDTLLFADDVAPGQVTVYRNGADMVLSTSGGYDTVTVANGFDAEGLGIERVRFMNGTIWEADDLLSRVAWSLTNQYNDRYVGTAGADVADGLGGDDVLF
jgi:hypothetical protein